MSDQDRYDAEAVANLLAAGFTDMAEYLLSDSRLVALRPAWAMVRGGEIPRAITWLRARANGAANDGA